MASLDFTYDLLQAIESQGLSYFLMILTPNPKDKTDDINIFTSLGQQDIGKVLKVLAEYKKNADEKDGKDDK